jgi:hypothetical protein
MAARTDANDWVTLRRPDQARAAAGSPDVRERIRASLHDGHVVVAPQKAVFIDGREMVGWWRIDPETGVTLGVGRLGAGQTSTEMAFTVAYVTTWVVGVVSFISCVGMDSTFSNAMGVGCFLCAVVDGVALGAVVYAILVAAPGAILAGAARGEAARAAAVTFACSAWGGFMS